MMAKKHRPAVNASTLAGFSRKLRDQRNVVLRRQAQPESAVVRRGQGHALRPGERRLQCPRLQQADRDDQGDGDLQHARLLVEEAAPGHPAYIRHYTKPGDIVLDPFCGSGGTACRPCSTAGKPSPSIAARPRRSSPRTIARPLIPTNFARRLSRSSKRSRAEIDWLYETRCDRCGGKARRVTRSIARSFSALAACRRSRSTTAAREDRRPRR